MKIKDKIEAKRAREEFEFRFNRAKHFNEIMNGGRNDQGITYLQAFARNSNIEAIADIIRCTGIPTDSKSRRVQRYNNWLIAKNSCFALSAFNTSALSEIDERSDKAVEILRLLIKYIMPTSNDMANLSEKLFSAISAQKLEFATELLKFVPNVNVNFIDLNNGDTTIHKACETQNYPLINILMKKGSNIFAKNKENIRPIDYLVVKNGSINHLNAILLRCCKKSSAHEVDLLLEAKADVNARGLNGNTPLTMACYHDNITVVTTLINKKANLLSPGYEGYTPLSWAILKNNTHVASLLLLSIKGKKIEKNRDGSTPTNLIVSDNAKKILDSFSIGLGDYTTESINKAIKYSAIARKRDYYIYYRNLAKELEIPKVNKFVLIKEEKQPSLNDVQRCYWYSTDLAIEYEDSIKIGYRKKFRDRKLREARLLTCKEILLSNLAVDVFKKGRATKIYRVEDEHTIVSKEVGIAHGSKLLDDAIYDNIPIENFLETLLFEIALGNGDISLDNLTTALVKTDKGKFKRVAYAYDREFCLEVKYNYKDFCEITSSKDRLLQTIAEVCEPENFDNNKDKKHRRFGTGGLNKKERKFLRDKLGKLFNTEDILPTFKKITNRISRDDYMALTTSQFKLISQFKRINVKPKQEDTKIIQDLVDTTESCIDNFKIFIAQREIESWIPKASLEKVKANQVEEAGACLEQKQQ